MALVETITNDYHFWEWLKQSDNYSNNFTIEGALEVQRWYETYSELMKQDIEFDPIAWCCEFSEYDSLADFNAQNWDDKSDYYTMKELRERTNVLKVDGGRIIVQEF